MNCRLVLVFGFVMFIGVDAMARDGYAIVVSRETQADDSWKPVIDQLSSKYRDQFDVKVLVYDKAVAGSLPRLREIFPKYTCFVATSAETTRAFVKQVHQLTRQFDADIYTDTRWGILTGYDAANALSIAKTSKRLTIRKAASGTEIALGKVEQGVWYCELVKNKMVRKGASGDSSEEKCQSDTTRLLVDSLNKYRADLFVTSGHATERDWQIGFRYRNGSFRSKAGQLFGVDTTGAKHPVNSTNPKVYMPIGNCLMGHINGPDAMALAFLNSAGVRQMIGYTVLTWYGYGGWGVLDYFLEQPGRYTFSEAFHVNHHALVHRLDTYFPGAHKVDIDERGRVKGRFGISKDASRIGLSQRDGVGLRFDRDVVAFYGDPAWVARMADGSRSYEQTLTEKNGLYTLVIKPNLGAKSFEPVNTNGAQRGWRPIMELLPHRIKDVKVIAGGDLNPMITDDFILIPNPRKCDVNREYRIVFKASRIARSASQCDEAASRASERIRLRRVGVAGWLWQSGRAEQLPE